MSGVKDDSGKVDLSLVSPVLQEGVARCMMLGAEKYGRHNYLSGFKYTRLLASLKRHLLSVERGEDYDEESGLHHLFHVAANVQMLVDNLDNETLEDDRYITKGKLRK